MTQDTLRGVALLVQAMSSYLSHNLIALQGAAPSHFECGIDRIRCVQEPWHGEQAQEGDEDPGPQPLDIRPCVGAFGDVPVEPLWYLHVINSADAVSFGDASTRCTELRNSCMIIF
jgi:hypothetical protein